MIKIWWASLKPINHSEVQKLWRWLLKSHGCEWIFIIVFSQNEQNPQINGDFNNKMNIVAKIFALKLLQDFCMCEKRTSAHPQHRLIETLTDLLQSYIKAHDSTSANSRRNYSHQWSDCISSTCGETVCDLCKGKCQSLNGKLAKFSKIRNKPLNWSIL